MFVDEFGRPARWFARFMIGVEATCALIAAIGIILTVYAVVIEPSAWLYVLLLVEGALVWIVVELIRYGRSIRAGQRRPSDGDADRYRSS